MDNKNACEEKCEFTAHPCNFKVKIKEIKPFHVNALESIVLNIRVLSNYNVNSSIKLKTRAMYGNISLLDSSTIIYKSTRKFSGFDLFQISVEDECGGTRIENILIHVTCK